MKRKLHLILRFSAGGTVRNRLYRCLFMLIILILPALGGCEKSRSGQEKLIILQSKVEIHDSFQKLLKQYEKETGVETVLRTFSGEAYTSNLNSTITNEEGPVIFSTGGYVNTWQYGEYLEELSDEEWADRIIDAEYLMPVTKESKIYGYPFNVEAFGILYNADLLREAGINADEIRTLSQFKACLKTLSRICDNPISLGFGETWIPGLHVTNIAFGHVKEPLQLMEKLSDGKRSLLQTAQFRDMVDVLDVLKDSTTEEIVITDYNRQITDFANGNCAMILNGSWAYSAVKNLNPDLNIDIMGLPYNDEDSELNQQFPKGITTFWCINAHASSGQKEAAKRFLDWLTFSPQGKDYILEQEQFVSPFYKTASEENPISGKIAAKEGLPFLYMNYPPGIGMKDWGASIQRYMAGAISEEKLLTELNASWTR